ncbi:MAG TPA: phosphotransferase [Acidimicrobiales bacterium]|nr:phosphotransferase [Acidimicrobiales bacterium]
MSGDEVTERNRRIAIAVNAMTGMSDDATFVAHFTDDAAWHLNRRSIHGHDGLAQISQRAREAFPHGIEREIRSVVAESDRVVIQHTNQATTKDGVDYLNEYVKVFEFAPDGLIRSVWEYLDSRYAVEVLSAKAPRFPAEWQAAFDWVEHTTGGRIVRWEVQPRWRPACFIDVDVDGTTVALYWRGARGALDHGISDLRYEYHVLQVLEAHGIPVPHIYGFCDEPEGLLLARLPGRTEMVDAADDGERVALLDEYVEIMARMHAIPVADFEARGMQRPTTSDELGLADFDAWERVYRAKKRGPAPMEEFGIRWIRRNMPPDRSKVCFVTADCGQFLFEHGRIVALLDFEFSYLGDPASDLAGLRCRDAAHSLGDMRRAIAKYGELTGDHIDPRIIDYHTVRFGWVNPLSLGWMCADPPREINYVQYKAWYVLCSMWSLDVLATLTGATVDPPAIPDAAPSPRAPAHQLMVAALDPANAPDAARAYELDALHRVAQYLEQSDLYGPAFEADNMAEVAEVLGHHPATWQQAEAELERFVLAAGPEHDAALVRLFHRRLAREKALLHPALGYLTGSRMTPIA